MWKPSVGRAAAGVMPGTNLSILGDRLHSLPTSPVDEELQSLREYSVSRADQIFNPCRQR